MAYVRTSLAGTPADDAHPVVVEAGISVLKAHIPLTSPDRERLALAASSTVVLSLVGVGLLLVAAATRGR